MKPVAAAVLFITACLNALAQSPSAKRDIFNFEVGDEVEIWKEYRPYPPGVVNTRITGKWYSAQKDTLFYSRFIRSMALNRQDIIYSGSDTLVLTALDSPARSETADTVYFEKGLKVTEYYKCDCNGFEDSWIRYRFTENLGLTYFENKNIAESWDQTEYLIHYKKGSETFGKSWFTGINDQSPFPNLQIYPNPVRGRTIYLDNCPPGSCRYNLLDGQGRTLTTCSFRASDKRMEIDLPAGLAAGLYMLKLQSGQQVHFSKIMVEGR